MSRLVVSIAISVLLVGISLAQTSTGEIDVTVVDSSGAVVPNATVIVTGAQTGNVVRTLKTDNAGIAAAPLLPPATYNLDVEANGFERLARNGINLNVGATVSLKLQLQTGGVTETVTVVGQTPLLQEKSAVLAETFNQTAIRQLPISGRSYLELGNLVAGAVPSSGSRDNTFSIYGNSGIQNAFLLDGARNQSYIRGLDTGVSGGNPVLASRDAYRPPLDALQEMSVQTSNFSAEYGASAGAVIMAVTKSGTNELHGSAYDFLRNRVLDAKDFFAGPGPKPQLVQNQFGGSLGGPIVKNHAWIFGAYEGTGVAQANTYTSTVPTATQRDGNFGSTRIYDPFSTVCNAAETSCTRALFPGNTIPASRLNSIGQSIVGRYPLPNQPGTANNFVNNAPQDYFNNNAVFRGDVQVTTKASMFARMAMTRYHILGDPALPPPAQTPVQRNVDSWGVGYGFTYTFSPTWVNEFRLNWTRIAIDQDATLARDEIIPGMLDPQIKSSIPTFNLSGYATIGAQTPGLTNDPLSKSSGTWDIADNATKSWGRHTLKFGAEFMLIRPTTFSALSGRGSMTFNGVFTQNPQARSGTGSSVADALLGVANNLTTSTVGQAVERGRYLGTYLQDDWTVTSNLTLNLGVRYELFWPYYTDPNRMANFILDPSSSYFGQMVIAGNPAFPRSLETMDKNNVAPRVGLAYHVPGVNDLVVRASYGIFYAQDNGWGVSSRMTNNPPFWGYGGASITSDQLLPTTGFVLGPNATAPRLPPITPSQFVLNPLATSTLTSWPLRYTTPYVQEWNLSIQKQLPWGLLWETDYVGNIGVKLWGRSQGNQPLTNGPGSPNNRRPLAQYTHAPINAFGPWNRSHYEGMSTSLKKRFSNGLQFASAFTYGKAMDLFNQSIDVCDGCNEGIQNSYNLDSLMGPADQDVRFRYTFAGTWSLPLGKGHRFASNGWSAGLLGSWQFNAVYTAQSGFPFTPVLNFDNANAGTTSWPNRVCNGTLSNPTLTAWFDTNCFVVPPAYQFGNSGRNVLRGPGISNLDFGLHRSFPIGERFRVEFRAEAFNAFNHPQFGQPGNTIGNPGVAKISSTSIPNREIQLALRLAF
ncbi:MAG TPA: TonB-dependent receptor [Bryobacteraceae bacterium]|nr:TonB-dependent receptor [Bryobacteraceae bacterium]